MKKNTTKKTELHPSLKGLIVLAGSLAMLLSLFSFVHGETGNWLGLIGYAVGKIFHALFGIGSYLFCLYFFWIGWRLLFQKTINQPILKAIYITAIISSLCMLLCLLEDSLGRTLLSRIFYPNHPKSSYHVGGALFYYLYKDLPALNLIHIFNKAGVALLSITLLCISSMLLTKTTPKELFNWIVSLFAKNADAPATEVDDETRLVKLKMSEMPSEAKQDEPKKNAQEMLAIQPDTSLKVRPSLSHKALVERKIAVPKQEISIASDKNVPAAPPPELPKTKRQAAINAQKVHNGDFKGYALPSPALLTPAKKIDQSSIKQGLKRQAEVLEETLLSFGIEAKVGQINCGPTITSFEVHPAIGVKVQKIRTLENDIALNMEAKSIRIIAPIPGKAAVGIEVPNAQPQEVGFKDMLIAYQQGNRKFHVPILLGKAVNGDYVWNDLAKMPHCIIAGATGSGKSVCINTIVMAIVMNAKPDEIKLVMVDPKKVELTPYTRLPHMLAPVITEPQGACAALNWLVKEMENRYEILKQLGMRNIEAFNTRTVNKELEESLDLNIPNHMPYIVVIIDELADLMMVASNDIETPIARIAQMARAVGIHLILATQRPSREVITGIIKANFPTRIAFKVASRVNSQIILDEVGAESLLGNGDMLFLPPGTSTLIRAQGAYIRDEDIAAVIKHACDQAPTNYLIASFDQLGKEEALETVQESSGDSLYDQALQTVLGTGNASTTFLQRKLKIGYARAASLIDELESKGVIGQAEGSKPRKILAKTKETALPPIDEA